MSEDCRDCVVADADIRQLNADIEELKDKLYEFADMVKEYDDSRDPLILVSLVRLARQHM